MTGFRQVFWRVISLAALGLAACGGGSSDGSVQLDGPPSVALNLQPAFPNLSFSSPVAMLQAPGDSSRWFVVEQAGQIQVFENIPTAAVKDTFVNIAGRVNASDSEIGLLGMAFHPNFPTDPRVYLFYSHTDATLGLVSRLSEFRTQDAGLTLDQDPGHEQVLLTIQKPLGATNHNGGGIAFGPDGFLYIGVGDGGGANDGGASNQHGPIGNGQSLTTLLGKMLRIDVDGNFPYEIPPDNPFFTSTDLCSTDDGTSTSNCPEIYAYGFRNPWRWSFDRDTDELWVADVGQGALEEVDRVTLGGNYGWRCFEGTRSTGFACGSLPNLLPPVAEYGRTVGRSITGGYVYRGSAIPSLVGRYVFGDFATGRIFSIAESTQSTLTVTGGFASGLGISSFAEDNTGELYVVDYSGGQLYRIVSP